MANKKWFSNCRRCKIIFTIVVLVISQCPQKLALIQQIQKQQVSQNSIQYMTKWTAMMSKIPLDQPMSYTGAVNLYDLIDTINLYINSVPYVSDYTNYNTDDYWASPSEFFENGGDCEDYAISKYLLLKNSGISPNDMRILVVKDDRNSQYHAVLLVNVLGKSFILDNTTNVVEDANDIDYYQLKYQVNEFAVWL